MAKFKFKGKPYRRDYRVTFCEICHKRIVFRISAKGIPEGSDKANKRRTCCRAHALELQRRELMETLADKDKAPDTSDPLDKFNLG